MLLGIMYNSSLLYFAILLYSRELLGNELNLPSCVERLQRQNRTYHLGLHSYTEANFHCFTDCYTLRLRGDCPLFRPLNRPTNAHWSQGLLFRQRKTHCSDNALANLFHPQPSHFISFIVAIAYNLVLCRLSHFIVKFALLK